MDFAWAVDALRRGLKVTRKAWLLTNSTMYLKMVKDAELSYSVARIFCMGRQASTWCPTQAELFEFTDWEEYVEPKKEPAYTTKVPFILTEQDAYGGKPMEELDLDVETNKAIALVSRNIAENLVELLRNPSVQRILHGNVNTNNDKED